MANSGNIGNVYHLASVRPLPDDRDEPSVSDPHQAEVRGDAVPESDGASCDCPDCVTDVLSFPPVALADEARLAAEVPRVPLVADARRLAAWTGTRRVTEERLLPISDARTAVAELGLPVPADRLAAARTADELPLLHLLWSVAVNTGLIRVDGTTAEPGSPGAFGSFDAYDENGDPRELLEFWDGVVMDVLDRADEGLTGSAVVDDHLAEMLATMYSLSDGIAVAALVKGILQSHEVACQARPEEMRRLTATLPGELTEALNLLAYCGLIEGVAEGRPRLTPLGLWAVRQDLLREGHDAPTLDEVAVFADLTAEELVAALLGGEAAPSAVAVWLERRAPADAARELLAVAASGGPGERGAVGTILEELGPEAEAPVREALNQPTVWRYAASWLHVRDLPAPPLSTADGDWITIDTLASLLHMAKGAEEVGGFEALSPDEELLRLVETAPEVGHPDTLAVLDMLAARHPEPRVAKAARKTAMRMRSEAI
ncbi:hypothetical protein SAMN04489764_3456 [Thermostaphylospora chromogena]|uniref:Uncharacterized protein n=1 Tax=Thermostaphylospora chromogena TaxID=35622 RepID=A0A1H1G9X2_9ACTN|nr:hypothetical protein SAMN04489764_3456 [Thermostaphylospora chromogena]